MRITDEQTEYYLRHGYVVVPDFLTATELAAAHESLLQYYPTAEELAATPQRYGGLMEEAEQLQNEFPFAGDILNDISTHPELIAFVERVLRTSDVLLSQAAIWAKYAGTGDFEQGMHLDYQGNSLVVPRDDGSYRQVNVILYYSDVTQDMGPTCIVSSQQTKDVALWPPFRTRKMDPAIYRKEKPVLVKAGGMLLFGMRTFHRASAMTAEFGARFSHHMVWRAAAHAFQGYHLWSRMGEKRDLADFLVRATPRQREVLGFPRVGDQYWNRETIEAVSMRYPNMDMKLYRVKMNG
jgi:ectoine hydroxylase-related dioxygenase (phytanoyl-CoA dioxygenase family)